MKFKYRLQKVLEIREQELEEAKNQYAKAKQACDKIQLEIQQNIQNQNDLKNKLSSGKIEGNPVIYTNRLKYLTVQKDQLEQELEKANNILEEKKEQMLFAQQRKEALVKHKEKELKKFQDAEQKKEAKVMNELALMMKRIKEEQDKEDIEN